MKLNKQWFLFFLFFVASVCGSENLTLGINFPVGLFSKFQDCNNLRVSTFTTKSDIINVPLLEAAIKEADINKCLRLFFDRSYFYFDKPIVIGRGNISLLGGPTSLFFSGDRLEEYYNYSNFNPSWEGGVLTFIQKNSSKQRSAQKVVSGKRYSNVLTVTDVSYISPGDIVQLVWYTNGKYDFDLLSHILGISDASKFGKRVERSPPVKLVSQKFKVMEIIGSEITLDKPLLHDVSELWNVELTKISILENVFVHGLDFHFTETDYLGHLSEHGFNSIFVKGVRGAVFNNISFNNTDSAMLIHNSSLVFSSNLYLNGRSGHYGFSAFDSDFITFTDFFINSLAKHSISANTGCQFCVFNRGFILRGRVDLHRGYNSHSFFNDITVVTSYNPLSHGGAIEWGPANGISTYLNNFNVYSSNKFECIDCFNLNFINLYLGDFYFNDQVPSFVGRMQ